LTGVDDADVLKKITQIFMTYYDELGYKKTKIYSDVLPSLTRLFAEGRQLYIATNKRTVPTLKILNMFNIENIFAGIYASDTFSSSMSEKSETIKKLLTIHEIASNFAWYIGDRAEDAVAASKNGLKFAFAEWGYGDKEEASNVLVDKIITSPKQFLDL
jgi:phosphoglycolate phosphatase